MVFGGNPDALELEMLGRGLKRSAVSRAGEHRIHPGHRPEHSQNAGWERGSGETWAYGTGACAAAVAAVENGFCDKDTDITVKLRGGDLLIRVADGTVYHDRRRRDRVYEGVVEI